MVSGLNVGLRTSISCAEINNDGAIDVIIGNYRGGVGMFSFYGDPVIGFDDLSKSLPNIMIYPNPSKGILKIKINKGELIKTLKIYDILGKVMISRFSVSVEEIVLDAGRLKAGLYLVQIQTGQGGSLLKKVLIQ